MSQVLQRRATVTRTAPDLADCGPWKKNMTSIIPQDKLPFFTFHFKPFHLSIGRGGRFVYISSSAHSDPRQPGDEREFTWKREWIIAWGGDWRYIVVDQREFRTASEAMGHKEVSQ